MQATLPVGRLLGARVRLNWSVLVTAWLLSWSLATYTLPETVPDRSDVAYWSAALLASVGFIAGVLAHELGHAAAARRQGIETEEITLWMFGGVAKLKSLGRTPRAELHIALAGPKVSAALALACFVAAPLASRASELAGSAVDWLGVVNITLVVFNLLPAAPLDGGRVLAAVLWRRWGDERRAHLASAQVGRGLGSALIVLGLFALLGTGAAGGLWFAFVGWFLISAADAEIAVRSMQSALGGRTAGEVMSRDPIVLDEQLTLAEAFDTVMSRWRHAAYPVVDARGVPTGLFTLRDLSGTPRAEWQLRRVADMKRPLSAVPTAQTGEPLADAAPRWLGEPTTRVLVFDGDRLVGIIAPSDIARLLEVLTLPRTR